LLFGMLALALRHRRFGHLNQLAAVAMLAILANAAVCGALSNPHDRYGARMVWLATLVVLLAVWAHVAERNRRVRTSASADADDAHRHDLR
jgi:hypothetical protein